MCTLTVYSGKKRCIVTMNRDELRTRNEAGILHSTSAGETRLFYPVDAVSGGTWFGVNNKGVILGLLNRYQAPETQEAVTRGTIIPEALAQGNAHAVAEWLAAIDYRSRNPFDLFLVSRKAVQHFSWDGQDYLVSDVSFKHWFMFSSSAIQTEEVIAFRSSFFQAWHLEVGKKVDDSDEIIRGFHMIQIPGMEGHSVLMDRDMAHTKSVIQADLMGKQLTLKYIPDVQEQSLDAPLFNARVETVALRKD